MTAASLTAKVVGFVQLIALAWFLDVRDFGIYTMASTFIAFATIPFRIGLEEILVQRSRRIRLWAGPAFWLSLVSGFGTMLLLLLIAPLAAWFYEDRSVGWLIALNALVLPVTAAMAVPFAKLSADLRFGTLAGLSVLQIVVQTGVALPLAWMGLGANSIVIGLLAAAIVTTLMHWRLAHLGTIGRPRVRRWRYFLRDGGYLQGMRLALAVAGNVDFVIVGRLGGAGPLGVYSYAYNQSLQSIRLIGANAANVLFPSLNSLGDDPARKYNAFLRGLKLVLPLLVPLSLLQAALAEPTFHLLFKPEYWSAIPLFQTLSVGMIGVGGGMLCYSLIYSLRRNDLAFAIAVAQAVLNAGCASVGWLIGGTVGVAVMIAVAGLAALAAFHGIGAHAVRRSTGEALRLYLWPALLGLISAVPAWCVVTLLLPPVGEVPARSWSLLRLAAGGAAFTILYVPFLWLLCRETFDELVRRLPVRRLFGRFNAGGQPASRSTAA